MKIKYKFTKAILVIFIFKVGISAATDSILTVDCANKTTTVNLNETCVQTVNNTEPNENTFNLTIENSQNAEAGLRTLSINLVAEMNGTVLLNVTNAISGVFKVNITAASWSNPDVNENVTTFYSRIMSSSKGGGREI